MKTRQSCRAAASVPTRLSYQPDVSQSRHGHPARTRVHGPCSSLEGSCTRPR